MAYDNFFNEFDFGLNNISNTLTWMGQKADFYIMDLSELCTVIPQFERISFSLNGLKNTNVDLIIRKPLKENESCIPVAAVSKQYALIQHYEVIEALEIGLEDAGLNVYWNHSELLLSEYGERMKLSIILMGYGFNPGDNHPLVLKVNCLNSVDKSIPLEINLSWYRLVCGNGLMFGMGTSNFRKLHLRSLHKEDIAEYLIKQIDQKSQEEKLLRDWMNYKVSRERIQKWIDEVVAPKWGMSIAARIYLIINTGFDGELERSQQKVKAHDERVIPTQKVPGAFSHTENVYHISQALSWVVARRNTVQDQLDKMVEIPYLINQLLKMES